MSRFIITLMFFSGIVFTTSVNAGGPVYRWTDAAGGPHFGDQPPTAGSAETVLFASSRPGQSSDAGQRREDVMRLLKAIADEHASDSARLARQQQKDSVQQGRCQQAERQLALYNLGTPIFREGEKGERLFIDDTERKAVLNAWSEAAERDCNGSS